MIDPGTLLQNRYRVAEKIGKGGMGEVYVATDERFQSTVAIKRTFYDDPEMSKAFEREARLLNRLRHAALPKVSDHFSEDGGQFLVMEFIEGSDFAELLDQRKAPFPLTDVLRWADELLDALDYLHTQEPLVVHRDIKPPNIKLTPRGKIVLLDFGLAKVTPTQTASHRASSVFGYSLNFAPLEQMMGSGTDPRSDLYSLAATLYSLLTCQRPPDAVTRATATIRHEPDPLRPAHLVQGQVPVLVGQILHRAMSQDSSLRHASASELRAELRQAANDDAAPREAKQTSSSVANVLQQTMLSPGAATPFESPAQQRKLARPALQARPQLFTPSRTLQRPSPSGEEAATITDSHRQPRPSDSYTVVARSASTRKGAVANRTFGLVACLLIVCAAASAYLLTRASSSRASNAGVSTAVQNSSSINEQIAPAERTVPNAGSVAADSSHDSPVPNASAESAPARTASETPASNSQAAAEATSAQNPDRPNANRDSVTTNNSNSVAAAASPSAKPTLVIQNPTPAMSQADEARRAEESRREQPEYRPEYTDRPPPGPAYPPQPGDWRPPPPDGRRPPPPFRRPYP
jgi:serine/threonine protein kinase